MASAANTPTITARVTGMKKDQGGASSRNLLILPAS